MELIPAIPPFLAILNTTAATLVSMGYIFVKRKNTTAHRACMITALLVSTVFMVFYLYYHAKVGNIPFAGTGMVRPVYFSLLASHVILAAVLFPLVLVTAGLALQGQHQPAPAHCPLYAADMALRIHNRRHYLPDGISHLHRLTRCSAAAGKSGDLDRPPVSRPHRFKDDHQEQDATDHGNQAAQTH